MQTYTITKAGAVGSACPDDTQISITGQPPETWKTLKDAGEFYEHEAEMLFHALSASLPGGTFDRLLGKMLAAKASLLRVPLFE